MRKFILISTLILFSFNFLISQCDYWEDFSSDNNWEQMGVDVEIVNGKLEFNNGSTDDTQRRIFKKLDTPYRSEDCWILTMEFTPESVGNWGGQPSPGHFICSLTENSQNPLYDCASPDCPGSPPGVQDAIIIDYTAINPPNGNLLFKVITKIDGIRYDSKYITYNELGVKIYIELIKECDDLILSLYQDKEKQIPIGNGPVYVQIQEMNELNYIQHGNNVGGDERREMTGELDDVCIDFIPECGPKIIEIEYDGCPGDGYEIIVNGTIYNEEKPTGTEYLKNETGCDTLANINMHFDDIINVYVSYSGCIGDGYEIEVNGNSYNEENPTGIEQLNSVFGCDSIIEINLNYFQSTNATFIYEGCQGDPFEVEIGGIVYNETNPFGISIIENSNRCDSVIRVEIQLRDCSCPIYYPNVFSPNNDGINDVFLPVSDCSLYAYILKVFDRWGNLVFESHDPLFGWDGTYKDYPALTGVYALVCIYKSHEFDSERKVYHDVLLLK